MGGRTVEDDRTGHVEATVATATVADLLGALTPERWFGPGSFRCPVCAVSAADPADGDPSRWFCWGRRGEVTPINPRSNIGARYVTCGVGTIWQLRRLVLEDAAALDRLLDDHASVA